MLNQVMSNRPYLNLSGFNYAAEYDVLLANQTQTLIGLLPHRKPVGCKWLFKIIENLDENVNKYKSRLVVNDY